MHKQIISLSLAAALVGAYATPLLAQDDVAESMPMPQPAPELQKFEPLIGNWVGKGTLNEPTTGKSEWRAKVTYKWALDGFWVQQDFTIKFDAMPQTLVFRNYLGWDAERKCHVICRVANTGEVGVDDVEMMPDGTLMMFAMQWNQMSFAERSTYKVDGERMTQLIEFLMPAGPSMTFVEGTFERTADVAPDVLGAGPFGPPPAPAMAQLGRGAGTYATKGSMVMMPGMPAMEIFGTDTFTSRFGGKILHGHTDGGAVGMPGKYASDVFWGWDRKRECFTSVFVSNMGEVGAMDMVAAPDGKAFISTMKGTMNGEPMVQRFVLHVDDEGAYTSGVGHTIIGMLPPFESFKATMKKQ